MKKILILFCLTIATYQFTISQVAINTDGTTPNSSAMLDIKSTTKGLLTPRMTSAQRNAIASPATGLLVYDTDVNKFFFYAIGSWIEMGTGSETNYWTLNGSSIYNNNAGSVGIGTSSPSYKLTVQTGNGYGIIHTNGTVSLGTYIGAENAGWFGTRSNHPLKFFTNDGLAQMTILQNGNVGIGTETPEALLDVARPSGVGTALFRGTTYASVFNYSPNEDTYIRGGKAGSKVIINDALLGNVGIGTDAPTDKLTVKTASDNYGFTHTDGTATVGSYVGFGGGWYGTKSNHPLFFFTNNGNAQLTIEPGTSRVKVGSPTDYHALWVYGALVLSDDQNWSISDASDGALEFHREGLKAYVAPISGQWIPTSDARLKDDILPYKSVLYDLKNLNVSTYRYKSDFTNSRCFGLIAQNVAQYFPEIVAETGDKNGNKTLGIAYGLTGVLAIKAIQEQQAIIETQQKKIEELGKRLEALENSFRSGK